MKQPLSQLTGSPARLEAIVDIPKAIALTADLQRHGQFTLGAKPGSP